MPFAAVVEVSALDGATGFQVNGEATNDYVGKTVAAAGDINGDGIQDFIISAVGIDPHGTVSGGAYVVFGTASGFPANLNLSALDGTNGFQINGESGSFTGGGSLGGTVSGAGDLNGDGVDDLIVGGPADGTNGGNSGAAWVIFGKDTSVVGDFTANVETGALNGSTGFQINGEAAVDQAGATVSSAGDVNGDGIDDVMVVAYRADVNGSLSGSIYVVFGKNTAFGATLELSSLDGTNGFQINGEAAEDYAGMSVSAAGDINNDGIDDLIIGAVGQDLNGSNSGTAYVVFGKNTGFAANLELSSLDGTNGFRMNGDLAGDFVGMSVAAAGDFNGDGIDDLVIGAYSDEGLGIHTGASFVVFGKDTALDGDFAASFDLSTLDGTNGVRINGEEGDYSGRAVLGAGDVNGDGIDDLLIGAYRAAPNGAYSGSAYVLFGKDTSVAGAFTALIDLADLDATTGVRINGEAAGDNFGIDVSAADVNGDGLGDLIIGAPYADPNGESSGAVYIIFGQPAGFVGNASDQTYSGTGGTDNLAGLGGKDILSGLGGDDVIDGGNDNDVLYGGDGLDDLIGGSGNDWLQGDAGADDLNGGDGADKLFGGTGSDSLLGGLGNDRMDGGSEADTLTGNDGNDYLDGGAGADVMTGGVANDVYIVDDAGDTTVELSGEGYDIVRTALDGWVLAANVEGMELQGSGDINGTGNAEANNLQGNSGGNTLSGLTGNDTINGADGDDIIIGGLGGDLLRGGIGADTFVVAHAFVGTLETDIVYDFSAAEDDILDLSGAFAGTLSIVSAFTKTAGQMTVTFAGGQTTVKLDINGDGKAEYQMRINGDVTTETGDWIL